MRSLSITEFKSAVDMFKYLPAFEAVDILCSIFNTPQLTFTDSQGKGSRQLVDLYDDYEVYCGMYARDYKITYTGGPPDTFSIIEGSLMTLVIDKFLRAYIAEHTNLVSNIMDYANEQQWHNTPSYKVSPVKTPVGG